MKLLLDQSLTHKTPDTLDAYIDGYDDEESELNKMLRELKELQQKKKQEQLNYENSAESTTLVAQPTAELGSETETKSATPVAQQTAKPSDNVLAANRSNAIQTSTGTGIEGSVLNNRYKAYLESKSKAESATPVAQQTADTVSHNSSSDTSEN
ncbi:hypothetical protein CIP107563_00223 [Corynebacterium diphtheriae]|nr:hypothetical protein CIP107563_00223 [Corynebacterium diphtheriae]